MSDKSEPKPEPSIPMVYQIRIKGHLDSQWTDWFGGLTIMLEENGASHRSRDRSSRVAWFAKKGA